MLSFFLPGFSVNAGPPFGANTQAPTPKSGSLFPLARRFPTPSGPRATISSQAVMGQSTGWFVVADFNNDGAPDTIALTGSGLAISLFRADGSTISVTRYAIPNVGTASIAAADFNHDGNLDLAITTAAGVAVLLGKGDGTFGPVMPLPAIQGFPFYLVAADLNGDGILDLAVIVLSSSGSGNGSVAAFLGKGDGTFRSPSSYTVGQAPVSIVAADVNNDGHLDLIALDAQINIVNRVWTLIGRGDGTFQAPLSAPTGTGFATLSYADINHDGNIDLLIADQSASAMAVMLGKGDGTYGSPVEYIATGQVAGLAPFPLDDGETEVAMADNVNGVVLGLTIATDGTVQRPVLQRVGTAPSSIAAGDLNGDGSRTSSSPIPEPPI